MKRSGEPGGNAYPITASAKEYKLTQFPASSTAIFVLWILAVLGTPFVSGVALTCLVGIDLVLLVYLMWQLRSFFIDQRATLLTLFMAELSVQLLPNWARESPLDPSLTAVMVNFARVIVCMLLVMLSVKFVLARPSIE